MSFTFNGQILFTKTATISQTQSGIGSTTQASTITKTQPYQNGTGTGNCTRSYTSLVNLAAAANTTLNLQSLVDTLNANLTFTGVKTLTLQLLSPSDNTNLGANASSVFIGNATANQALTGANQPFGNASNGGVRVFYGGFYVYSAPNGNGCVVDATHANLKITNEDATNTAALLISIDGMGT